MENRSDVSHLGRRHFNHVNAIQSFALYGKLFTCEKYPFFRLSTIREISNY